MTRSPINLAERLAKVTEFWSPRVVAEMNDYQFKVVKVKGKFVWHRHVESDETFIVLKGELEIAFRDGSVLLRPGEMYVVPKGLEHITSADTECHVLVVEPRGVVNTGDAGGTFTARNNIWA